MGRQLHERLDSMLLDVLFRSDDRMPPAEGECRLFWLTRHLNGNYNFYLLTLVCLARFALFGAVKSPWSQTFLFCGPPSG